MDKQKTLPGGFPNTPLQRRLETIGACRTARQDCGKKTARQAWEDLDYIGNLFWVVEVLGSATQLTQFKAVAKCWRELIGPSIVGKKKKALCEAVLKAFEEAIATRYSSESIDRLSESCKKLSMAAEKVRNGKIRTGMEKAIIHDNFCASAEGIAIWIIRNNHDESGYKTVCKCLKTVIEFPLDALKKQKQKAKVKK